MTTNTYSQETEHGSQRKSQRLKSANTSAAASSTTATTPNQEKKRTAPTNPEEKAAKKQQSNKCYQWDSKWPDPDTEVAKLACAPTTAEQIQKAADLYDFVSDHEFQSNIAQLNTVDEILPVIVGVPGQLKVRVVYGIGSPNTGLMNDKANYLLGLVGDINADDTPDITSIPDNAFEKALTAIPTEDAFRTKVLENEEEETQLEFTTEETVKAAVPQAIPIPAYVVADGFEDDVSIAIIYERIQSLRLKTEYGKKLLQFLRGLSTIPNGESEEPTAHIDPTYFSTRANKESKTWRKKRMQMLNPLAQQNPTGTQQPAQIMRPGDEAIKEAIAMMAKLHAQQARSRYDGEEKKDDGLVDTTKFGLHSYGFKRLLTMCGITEEHEENLPEFWKQLGEKGLTKADKKEIVREALATTPVYRGCKVPILPQITSMFIERTFHGDHTTCTVHTAPKGLSPFAMTTISEADIAKFNDDEEAMYKATTTSIEDHQRNKIVAKVPDGFYPFMEMIKKYTNMLEAGFGELCPLAVELQEIVDDLYDMSEVSRAALTKQAKASILWAILLQSRHFANGKMKGASAMLNQFTSMTNAIKKRELYISTEVPPALYEAKVTVKTHTAAAAGKATKDTRAKDTRPDTPNDRPQIAKQIKRENRHPLVTAALQPIFTKHPRVSVYDMCKPCRLAPMNLFPDQPNLCLRSTILGVCSEDCKWNHTRITDEQATTVIEKLKTSIDNPDLIVKSFKVRR